MLIKGNTKDVYPRKEKKIIKILPENELYFERERERERERARLY